MVLIIPPAQGYRDQATVQRRPIENVKGEAVTTVTAALRVTERSLYTRQPSKALPALNHLLSPPPQEGGIGMGLTAEMSKPRHRLLKSLV